MSEQQKDKGLAIIISILAGFIGLLGIGHIYLGRTNEGIKLLVIGLALIIIGLLTVFFIIGIVFIIGYFVLYIWAILDVNKIE